MQNFTTSCCPRAFRHVLQHQIICREDYFFGNSMGIKSCSFFTSLLLFCQIKIVGRGLCESQAPKTIQRETISQNLFHISKFIFSRSFSCSEMIIKLCDFIIILVTASPSMLSMIRTREFITVPHNWS